MNLNDAFDAGMEGDIYIIPTDDVQSDENSGAEDDDNIEHIPARILRSTVEVASENEDDDIGYETPVVKRQKRESSRYSETIDEREFKVLSLLSIVILRWIITMSRMTFLDFCSTMI